MNTLNTRSFSSKLPVSLAEKTFFLCTVYWPGQKQVQSRVSAEFQVRYESLKSKFSFLVFLYNLMISCPKIEKIIQKNAFDQKKKKPTLKFKSWITLTSYWCKIWLLPMVASGIINPLYSVSCKYMLTVFLILF